MASVQPNSPDQLKERYMDLYNESFPRIYQACGILAEWNLIDSGTAREHSFAHPVKYLKRG